MSLDVYAGTLTRYYSQNWTTSVQQWAEDHGYPCQQEEEPGSGISENDIMTPDEIRLNAENWRNQILSAITAQTKKPHPVWIEDNSLPYFTARPGWDAYDALKTYGACRMYNVTLPPEYPEGTEFEETEAAKVMGEKAKAWSIYTDTSIWIPLRDNMYIHGPMPSGELSTISTTGALLMELGLINDLEWKAGRDTIISWSRTEGYPSPLPGSTSCSTESLAKYAFSILYRAALFSGENDVPVLLDY